jgi:hypothetical protein
MDEERHAILSRAAAHDRSGLGHFPNVNLGVLPDDGRNGRTNLDGVVDPQEAGSVVGSDRQREAQSGKDVARLHGEAPSNAVYIEPRPLRAEEIHEAGCP